MLSKILIPLDGSLLAEEALDYVESLLAAGGEITLVSIVSDPEPVMYDFYPVAPAASIESIEWFDQALKQAAADARSYLDNKIVELEEKGYTVKSEVYRGDPAEVIVELSDSNEVDAVVMSTHGRSGISRWIFGSVAAKVLGETHCPVFVVPSKKKRDKRMTDLVESVGE